MKTGLHDAVPPREAYALIGAVLAWGVSLLIVHWIGSHYELPFLRYVEIALFPAAWLVGYPLIKRAMRPKDSPNS